MLDRTVLRLWSIHPRYLDARGIVALWREGLLAQKVLAGQTAGYRYHPQLQRFRATRNPVGAIASYLRYVADEADRRGYNFDRNRIANKRIHALLSVTQGQIEYEFLHLQKKLKVRDSTRYKQNSKFNVIDLHPLFSKTAGGVENWEIISRSSSR